MLGSMTTRVTCRPMATITPPHASANGAFIDTSVCIKGSGSGPLTGLTFGAKDLFDVRGRRCTGAYLHLPLPGQRHHHRQRQPHLARHPPTRILQRSICAGDAYKAVALIFPPPPRSCCWMREQTWLARQPWTSSPTHSTEKTHTMARPSTRDARSVSQVAPRQGLQWPSRTVTSTSASAATLLVCTSIFVSQRACACTCACFCACACFCHGACQSLFDCTHARRDQGRCVSPPATVASMACDPHGAGSPYKAPSPSHHPTALAPGLPALRVCWPVWGVCCSVPRATQWGR